MAGSAAVQFIIAAKDAASRAINSVNRSLGKLNGAARVARQAVSVAAVAVAALGAGMLVAVKKASDFNESLNKTKTVLGEASDEVIAFAATAADSIGMSSTEALDAAATFAIFGKSANLSGSDLASFSTDLTSLAADFGSFYNASNEDAIIAIGAALRGESEPIRKYGVLLNEATLRDRAFRMGLIKTTKQALTPQQKVLAAQAEIIASATKTGALGDFAKTLENSLPNQLKKLTAQFENLTTEMGQKFVPIALTVVRWANKYLVPAIKALVPRFIELGKKVRDLAKELAAKLAPTIKQVAAFVQRDLVPAFKALGAFVQNTVLPAIGGFFKFLSDNRGAVAFLVGAVLGLVAAFKIFGVVMAVVRVATLAAAAAQAVLNFLLTANPIGLVVLAIAALIAGLAAAYLASEDFRKVVDGVFKVLGQVAGVIFGALGTAFGFLVGILETVMAVVTPIAHVVGTVLGGAFSILGGILEFVGGLFGKFIKMVTDSPLFKIAEGIGGIAGGIADFITGGDKKKTAPATPAQTQALGAMFGRTAPVVAGAAAGSYSGGPSGAPVTNVSVTLDGKNIATSVDKRLGAQARAFTPARAAGR